MTVTPFRYAMDEAILSEVRAAIRQSRVPLKDLARDAGVSSSAVHRTVIGSAALSVGELSAIAGALGTTGAELMERAEQSLSGPCSRHPRHRGAAPRLPGPSRGGAP
ncbi:helix-turn-helix domain-containing protein [Actinomyces capricornis]|uniref:HTH cro/C1-type domain-containing protein n=1 Tax=Actinomyces capricornis TaxID=2755559 RepID=A0ABM7UD52_9ACTO|nr:helix-turn-helix transcriptional regulator [Actinomyces capricornis]BDA65105.1 hypothetical protein MANAM107_19390 [Actinomyces capricornis]